MKNTMQVLGIALLLAAACGKSRGAGDGDRDAANAGAGGDAATVPSLSEEAGAAAAGAAAGAAAAAGGADGSDRFVPVDADGCPSGNWRDAGGHACLRPSRDCLDPGDCSTPGAVTTRSSIECVDGLWKYRDLARVYCSPVVLGPDGCPEDYRDADGYPCEDPSASCPPTGCEIPLLLCVNNQWEYNFHESDCSPTGEEVGGGGQSVGGSATNGGQSVGGSATNGGQSVGGSTGAP